MNITLRVGPRARRAVSVGAGAALLSGLGLVAAAPGALAGPGGEPGGPNQTCPAGSELLAKFELVGRTYVRESGGGVAIGAGANAQGGTFRTTYDGTVLVVVKGATSVVVDDDGDSAFTNAGLVNGGGQLADISNVQFCGVPDGPATSQPPTSQPPTSQPPTSQPPTDPGTSEPPTSQPPTSQPPTSQPPTSQPPTSQPPTSQPPTSQPPTGPAASCPGIGDGTDYRTLFDYEYFAQGADGGWVSLGSSTSWSRPLSVQYLNGFSTDPISGMMVRAIVTLKDGVDISAGGCEYVFSLASYEAKGPTFPTSGQQVLIDVDTDTITEDDTSITLEVEPAVCYGQSDLYKTGTVYSGKTAPRGPNYAPITRDGNLVANWGGGLGCDATTTPPPSEPPTSQPPTSQPPTSPPPTSQPPTDPGTSEPPTSAPPTSQPPTSQPPTSQPPTSQPPTAPGTSEPPTSQSPTSVPPTSTPPTGRGSTPPGATTVTTTTTQGALAARTTPAAGPRALARTGVETWTVALVAGVLLLAGGAMTALAQNTRSRRH